MSLEHLLEPESIAIVGATPRPGSFGDRLLTEVMRSPARPEIHLVNPRYRGEQIGGLPVAGSLAELAEPVDLVLLAVGDASLEAVLREAAAHGDRSAVIYGSAVDPASPTDSSAFRARLADIASSAGMALCGGGCMGVVSPHVRAIGYLERAPLPPGPIALITHSGSAFSAMLRTDRPFGFSLAVSSGQELVTPAAEYLEYALSLPETGVVALFLETLRAPAALRTALSRAAEADVPVVALTVGASEAGRAMVAAHSGALAGSDGAFEALFDAHGVLRVQDLAEMCDTLELLVAGRRAPARPAGSNPRGGIAAVLDSGAERALLVDVAEEVGVGFSEISPMTTKRLASLLDPGLQPDNPLDVWGTGSATEELFCASLLALAEDESVDAVAFAVDLVPQLDGDESYGNAVARAWQETGLPLCVLSHVPSALDRRAASRLRVEGIPVLEGTRTGLLALKHLLELRDFAARDTVPGHVLDSGRAARARSLEPFALLETYGIATPRTVRARDREAAVSAASEIGMPVAMKTAVGGIAHKTEAGGVILGISSPEAAARAYDSLARLGPEVDVSEMAPQGVELALGIMRDPTLGPLVVVGAGGVLVELLADRVVALPPLDRPAAGRLLDRLRIRPLLDGFRGSAAVDLDAVCDAVVAMSHLAAEAGDELDALDVNPLSCSPSGVLALDVLVEWRNLRSA